MIPATFTPPGSAGFGLFQLAVLGPAFAEPDLQAVRASAARIRHVFGPDNDWPAGGISHEENLRDLARHEQEFHARKAFAYALLSPCADQYLGCLYLKPIKSRREPDRRKTLFQAQAFLWLSVLQSGLDEATTLASLRTWFDDVWPLEAIAWPGRTPSWREWEALS